MQNSCGKQSCLLSKLNSQSPLKVPTVNSHMSCFSSSAAFYLCTITYFIPTVNISIYFSTDFQKCGWFISVTLFQPSFFLPQPLQSFLSSSFHLLMLWHLPDLRDTFVHCFTHMGWWLVHREGGNSSELGTWPHWPPCCNLQTD